MRRAISKPCLIAIKIRARVGLVSGMPLFGEAHNLHGIMNEVSWCLPSCVQLGRLP